MLGINIQKSMCYIVLHLFVSCTYVVNVNTGSVLLEESVLSELMGPCLPYCYHTASHI